MVDVLLHIVLARRGLPGRDDRTDGDPEHLSKTGQLRVVEALHLLGFHLIMMMMINKMIKMIMAVMKVVVMMMMMMKAKMVK